MQSNPNQGQPTRAQFDELLRRQRKADRRMGCLMGLVWTWAFGIFYWSWLAMKWTTKGTWALTRWSWEWLCVKPAVWTWRGSVALYQAARPQVEHLYQQLMSRRAQAQAQRRAAILAQDNARAAAELRAAAAAADAELAGESGDLASQQQP